MSIMTFGASEEKRQVCESVKVRLHNQEGEDQEVLLLAVLLFLSLFNSHRLSAVLRKYSHLRWLELVELEVDIEPDILISSDHY